MDTATGTATANRYKAALWGLLVVVGALEAPHVLGQTTGDSAQELTFLPGVRTSLRQSWRNPDDAGLGGSQLEVTPYFSASANTSRLRLNASYSMRNFYRFGETNDRTALRHSFNGFFDAPVAEDRLRISGSAQIGTINASPLGFTAPDPGATFTNTANFRTYNIRPYILGDFSTFARYRGEYSYTSSSITSAIVAKDDHRLTGTLNSGSQFGPNWGWSTTGTTQRRTFEGGLKLDRNTSSATAFYFPNPELRLGVSVNYDQIDGLVARNGDTRGIGPGASIDWAPNSRLRLSATVVDQYYGTNATLNGTYQRRNTTIGLNYNQGVITSFSGSLFNVDPAAIFGGTGAVGGTNSVVQQLILSNLLAGFGIPAGAGVTNDTVILDKSLTFTIGQALPRGGLSFTAFRSDRSSEFNVSATSSFGARSGGQQISVFSTSQLNRTGVRLAGNYRLDQSSTLTASIRQDRFLSTVSNIESSTNGLDLGYSVKATQSVTASGGIRFTRFNIERPTPSNIDETILFGTLDLRF